MISRIHHMPFGAEQHPDGGARFRLWAPAARRVELSIAGAGQPLRLAMESEGNGWHRLETAELPPGGLYRYRIDGGQEVPDPASRFQPRDVHGPSELVDPRAFQWHDGDWRGRPWEESVFYELHVGSFSPEGSFRGAIERLPHLAELGVTAIELMPVSDFPGARNWGYDGVLPFAPDSHYGRPEDLKALIQAAHGLGLSVFLDVVYNHFGPDGNWLHLYAPGFFTDRHQTPWGDAIDFDGEHSRPVRDFFIHNAIYWLREYHLDGLRLDAVHAIADDSRPHILIELADAVHGALATEPHRQVHLVLENDANAARFLERREDGRPRWYAAQWNDDAHHVLHLLLTGEGDGYYGDYTRTPVGHLGRCLTEGFAYQGEPSDYRKGARRGESTHGLPPTAFVNLIQNHDQVGNRAFGERIGALAGPEPLTAALAILLLAPSPPLLFMGQEWGATSPFLYFCDFGEELARAVTEGRRREFARFERFADPAAREAIPDPNDPETFLRSRLNWRERDLAPHAIWLDLHRALLRLRHREIVPRLSGMGSQGASFTLLGPQPDPRGLVVEWRLGDGSRLRLAANLDDRPLADPGLAPSLAARPLYVIPADLEPGLAAGALPPWSVAWHLDPGGEDAGSEPG